MRARFGSAPHALNRFQDLLARVDLDAVTIVTPDSSRGTILTAALQAAQDVYLEKPMTINLSSANRALD